MTSLYRYLFGSTATATTTTATAFSLASNGGGSPPLQISTDDSEQGTAVATKAAAEATETTSLLATTNGGTRNHGYGEESQDNNHDNQNGGAEPTRTPEEQSATDFYFPPSNPTVQRYYRFTSTTLTPIAALHRRPGTANTPMATSSPGGVTGLLRRSAVVPSHGTDSASYGNWILVSVGGRSGWARKANPANTPLLTSSPNMNGPTGGFVPADRFRATEAWMGNHFFFCGGRYMLGSDAASLVMTNGLILVGTLSHFAVLLPRLAGLLASHHQAADDMTATHKVWLLDDPVPLFWTSLVLTILTFVTLWWTALTDPGILPPVSSPVKPAVPVDGPLGGPLGYRYCSTCNIFRPPRSKHCNACNCCVSKFDHHCEYMLTPRYPLWSMMLLSRILFVMGGFAGCVLRRLGCFVVRAVSLFHSVRVFVSFGVFRMVMVVTRCFKSIRGGFAVVVCCGRFGSAVSPMAVSPWQFRSGSLCCFVSAVPSWVFRSGCCGRFVSFQLCFALAVVSGCIVLLSFRQLYRFRFLL
jgi:hypothetical protein